VTISLGEERIFRLRRYRVKGGGSVDLRVRHGTILVMPLDANRAWTHEVPGYARQRGRRISITLRAFEDRIGSVESNEN
jgi:alkylated DNA repair dioxygenase AlkB